MSNNKKTISEISNLSKDGNSQYFRPQDIDRLNELCKKSGLDIQFDSPIFFVADGQHEMYWLPHKFVIDKYTGKPLEDPSRSKKVIIEGYKLTNWMEELKKMKELKKRIDPLKLEQKEILDSIWIKVSLV